MHVYVGKKQNNRVFKTAQTYFLLVKEGRSFFPHGTHLDDGDILRAPNSISALVSLHFVHFALRNLEYFQTPQNC